MPNAHTIRLLVVAAAIELATGVSLYAFPQDFSAAIYASVLPYFPYLSAALLAGGLLLLLLVRYTPALAFQRMLALGAAGPVVVLAWYILGAGGYTGAASYLFLALGMLAAVWLPRAAAPPKRERAFDLFSLTLGLIHLAISFLMLGLPTIFRSPAFAPIRPALPAVGLLSLAIAALLLAPRRLLPLWAHRVAGAILPAVLCYTFFRSGAWTGVVMWALWAAGSLLDSHPALSDLRRSEHVDAADRDDDWAARSERILETWAWTLTLLVVVVTSFLGPSAASLPGAFLFVAVLGGYNVIACWILPLLGTPLLRLNLHLLVIALAAGLLLTSASPIASAMLPVFLGIPMVSARAGGRRWGYAMLVAVLAVLLLSHLMALWLEGRPPQQVLANVAVELVTLGVTGTLGVIGSARQRRAVRELEQTSCELAERNEQLQAQSEELQAQSEELLAANEELQAQAEELAAQQEELLSQHQRLIEQQATLSAQRDELMESEVRFRAAFEGAPIGMALISLDMRLIKANQALGAMLGYAPDELTGRTIASITHPDDYPSHSPRLDAVRAGHSDGYQFDKRYLHRDGRVVWVTISTKVVRDSHSLPLYLISQMMDVTERRRAEEQLRHLANYDPLTDLINRRRFQQEVEERLAQSEQDGHLGALLFLDFDQFKFVNDTLGHHAGDELLKGLARVLAATLGQRGSVARLGGDEFAMLVPGACALQAEVIATEILSAVRSHIDVVGGQSVGMTVSIGIALYPEHGRTVDDLMLHADLAMYQAKESGRNRHRIYISTDREVEMGSRLNWESRLREALEEDRFALCFQPILDLHTGQVMQYEALLRLVERDGTLISPRQFLGVAESYGLIHAIDRWVVRRAIRTIAEERQRRRRLTLAVNLSARAFSDAELLPLIQAELLAHDVQPQALHFEITETAAVADITVATAFIETLTGLGCRFSLDDFGAGFSSLVYLKRLPVSCLKIDGSFIERLPEEPVDQKMVKAVVTLARELGMTTVAECVGSDESLTLLRELGVDAAQGYHVGRPAPLPFAR